MPRLRRATPGFLFFAWILAAAGTRPEAAPFTYTPALEAVLDHISADSLRGHLSFISSDLLAGRDTPSPGLDIAAEYIAAQFRRANLEAAGGDGYFQTARLLRTDARPESFEWRLLSGGREIDSGKREAAFPGTPRLDIRHARAVKVRLDGPAEEADLAGKVVIADFVQAPFSRARIRALRQAKPALVVALDRRGELVRYASEFGFGNLTDPDDRALAPWIILHDPALAKACDGDLEAAVATVKLAAPAEHTVEVRNVAGLLRGSDPALRDTCVLLTAHYDHVGVKANCTGGDCIFNGANDDGSGTVSLIEIAAALANLHPHPRRSILFVALFGEEKGGLGAQYYTRHPLFPLESTVADVNLEQLGRTDASDGAQVGTATFTGFGFSDLPITFQEAGKLTGIHVYDSPASNEFFGRSDNLVFAQAGIPAHTLAVAYEYPDYHAVGDSWDKIDYANMARVDRMIAVGLAMLAGSPRAPRWNAEDPKARPYLDAWKQRHTD